MKIPAYLTTFNLLTWTRNLARDCERLGFEPILMDNASTYPPLLDWYESCPYKVVRLGANHAAHGFFHRGEHLKQDGYYVVSDTDLDLSGVPGDLFPRAIASLKANPQVPKCGLSLEINDLPAHYPFRDSVYGVESPYWRNKTSDGSYLCLVDTTFAVYDPSRSFDVPNCIGGPGFYAGTRLDRPYTARHLPWYLDPDNLDDEYEYYLKSAQAPLTWTMHLQDRLGLRCPKHGQLKCSCTH